MATTTSNGTGATAAPAGAAAARFARWSDGLFRPADGASLAFLRVCFGVIMVVECWRFFHYDWIAKHYIWPNLMFKYYGFEWVQPWPGDGMYWHFAGLAMLSTMIALGLFYRLAMVLFFLGFSYVFLLDQARYLNHFYLVLVFAALMILTPASRTFSLDALIARARHGDAAERTVPWWSIWLLRAQMEVLLIYAGLVKVSPDWLRLEPLRMWLAMNVDFPLIGHLFREDWMVATGVYGVVVLHLFGAPLLLFRRTRLPVTVVYFTFHVSNAVMFPIGIFPWFTMAGTMMFFDPDWPVQLWRRLCRLAGRTADA